MVGVITQFPNVGDAFFGTYRDARRYRLQEAAMRAEMAAQEAERARQQQARSAYATATAPSGREMTSPGVDFGLVGGMFGIPNIEPQYRRTGPSDEERQAAMYRLAEAEPEWHQALLQSQGSARDFGVNENVLSLAQTAFTRLESGQMAPEDVMRYSYEGAVQAGYRGGENNWHSLVGAVGAGGQADLERVTAINPQTGLPEYAFIGPDGEARFTGVRAPEPSRQNFTFQGEPVAIERRPGSELGGWAAGYIPGAIYEQRLSRVGNRDVLQWELVDEADGGRGEGEGNDGLVPAGLPSPSIYSQISLEESQFAQEILRDNPLGVSGYRGIITAFINPQSEAGSFAAVLENLKSNVAFDRLQQIRLESPTGGAVGNVSNFEQRMLMAAIGDISQIRSPVDLARRLARYEAILRVASSGVVWDDSLNDGEGGYRLPQQGDRLADVDRLGYNDADAENGLVRRGRGRRNITLQEVYALSGINPTAAADAMVASIEGVGEVDPEIRQRANGYIQQANQ